MQRTIRALTAGTGSGIPRSLRPALVILAAVIVVIVASVPYSLHRLNTVRTQAGRVSHTHEVLLAGASLLSLMKDAETGQRGFLLTGDESYLEPYNSGAARAHAELEHLASLVSDNPAQTPRVGEARRLVAAKLAELEATIQAWRQGGPDAARAAVRTGSGKRTMDALRGVMTAVQDEEVRLLEEREGAIGPAVGGLRVGIIAPAAFVVLLLVAVGVLVAKLARRQSELARSRDLIATTLASIGDGVIVTDARGMVTFLNAEAERLTGWTTEEAAGRALPEVFRIVNEETREPVENPVEKVLRAGTVVGLANHTILIARDGTETPIDDSAAPIRPHAGDGGGGPLFGVVLCFRDFSEHKSMEQQRIEHQRTLEARVAERTAELSRAHERVRVADRMAAVGTLAAGLAHDMKNVLLPVGARMDVLLATPALPGEARSELAVVTALLDHLKAMARNLSLFAQDPERDGVEGRTDLARWCGQVRGFIDASTGAGVVIRWDVPEGLPHVAVAPHRLTQAVQNLVHNARDAIASARGADGGAGDVGRIAVEARAREGHVTVRVIDNGCGMTEEVRRRCTEPFFTTKDRLVAPGGAGGTGLGLSLACTVIERAGGEMTIESETGKGTTVTLALPVAPAESPAAPSMGPARVSIEDKRTRAVVIEMLRSLRYEALDGRPEAGSPSIVWITDGSGANPDEAAELLRAALVQRVVVLGGDDGWRAAGAAVCERTAPASYLRRVIAGELP